MIRFRECVLLLLLVGCDFDEERQLSIRYPVTLTVLNRSENTIRIDYIFNSAASDELFAVQGEIIKPGGSMDVRISESVYREILARHYWFAGLCGDLAKWEIGGDLLEQRSVESVDEWSVTIFIRECEM